MKFNFNDTFDFNQEGKILFLLTKEFLQNKKCDGDCKCGCHNHNENNPYFKGEKNENLIISNPLFGDTSILYGLGEEEKLTNLELEKIGYELCKFLKQRKDEKFILVINGKITCKGELDYQDKSELMLYILNGMQLGDYDFDKYKTKKDNDSKKEKQIFVLTEKENLEKEFKKLEIIKENVFFCRDLVSEPSNVLNPESYAKICESLVESRLEVEVFGEKEMQKLGMNTILTVGQGSNFESKLVILKWKGLEKFENPIAFVGKGITFDSGGINIKPSSGMEEMKGDMAGSATVVSTMKLLAERKAKVNAVGIVALVENMPSGTASKPSDIVKSMSGQTIEILNTDAEGRLILSDSLYYTVAKFNPTTIIDLATLTGAICVALGEGNAGVFTNNDELANEIKNASEKTGENTWRMPLSEIGGYYDKLVDSEIADVKNVGGRDGGAITAAQFLQRFIANHKKWAHIDIAATSFIKKENYFVKKGETGFGVRLLNEIIKDNYEK